MTPRLNLYAAGLGLALIVGSLAVLAGLDSCHRSQGESREHQAAIHEGEATTHAQAAESIPDHTAELAALKAETACARAEVDRLKQKLARPSVAGPAVVPVPLPTVPQPPVGSVGGEDERGDLVERLQAQNTAQAELIEAQDRQIKGLELALSDEQKRSSEFKAAYEHEQKARMAQEAATKAWKDAVSTSRTRGRLEGFAAGLALGFVGGRR